MFEYLWAFFSNDAVSSIIALAAFILSVVLAISAVRRNILRIKVEESTIIFSPKNDGFLFLYIMLSNKSSLPFSLFSAELSCNEHSARKSDVVFNVTLDRPRIQVKHIPFVQRLPLMFAPYESRDMILSFQSQHLSSLLRRLLETENHSVRKPPYVLRAFQLPLSKKKTTSRAALSLLTSRGKRVCILPQIEAQDKKWIEDHAMRSAIYEKSYEYFE